MKTKNIESKLMEKGIMKISGKGLYRIVECTKLKQKTENYPTHIIKIAFCDYKGNLTGTTIKLEAIANFDMDADIKRNLNFSTLDKEFHINNYTEDFRIKVESNDNHYEMANILEKYIIKHAKYNQNLNNIKPKI